MNIEQLYRDYSIPYATEGHKHTREGWINTECPFCTGNPGLHLGYDTNLDRFVCWRCGGHNQAKVISALLNISTNQAYTIIRQYGFVSKRKENKALIKLRPFKYPEPFAALDYQHKAYLIKRGFDPEQLEKEWGLFGTNVHSVLDNINYKHRIIIPYTWDGQVVSFDSRDITERAGNKYMACPDKREIVPRKSILFGKQSAWTETGICVEGAFDVFRLGKHAFATSGIKYTAKQMKLISKLFKRVFIIYDNEYQAQIQAKKLCADLQFRGVDCHILTVGTDPGSMEQKEAIYLIKQLIK